MQKLLNYTSRQRTVMWLYVPAVPTSTAWKRLQIWRIRPLANYTSNTFYFLDKYQVCNKKVLQKKVLNNRRAFQSLWHELVIFILRKLNSDLISPNSNKPFLMCSCCIYSHISVFHRH